MKNNYELNEENGIKKTTLLASTIIIFIVATILGISLIKAEYSNFKSHIKNFRTTLIQREMYSLQTNLENLKKDIEYEKIALFNNKKQRIKNQSIIAYNLAYSLYNNSKNLNYEDRVDLIKTSLLQISQKESDINYFILNKNGTLLLNSDNRKNENVNFLDLEDLNGFKFVNEIINSSKNTQNYIEYQWFIPTKRISYSRHLEELDLIIGSGSYLENSENDLKQILLKKISLKNLNTDEFLFIYKIDGLSDMKNNSSLLMQKNIISNKKELEVVEKLMINTNYKANEFINYDNNKKLLYGIYIEDLRYFIAVGINLNNINEIVKKEKEISFSNMNNKIVELLIMIFIIILIFFILSFLFTKKIASIFTDYKKSVLENEQKYQTLFNHSNDAFIISKIIDNEIIISSFNKTAENITCYNNELIKLSFLNLFIDLNKEELLKNRYFTGTKKLKTKNNKIKIIELNTVLYNTNNEKYLFASLRDITERTQLKQEKEKQNKILIQKSKMASMGEMIGNIAHQWRQPLTQLSGLFLDIESAYDYKELDKAYLKNRINDANDLLEYMSKTIDDFKNYFNPNSKKESFYIKDAVQNALKIVNSTLLSNEIQLELNIDENLEIIGYKNEYSQAIMNIVTNAKDILKERNIKNPKIKIYTINENIPKLIIEDNAGGIPPEIIDKIFDPYFTTKYEYGTGIGLYMVKLIIEEKMGGNIGVKNSINGAVFTIEV